MLLSLKRILAMALISVGPLALTGCGSAPFDLPTRPASSESQANPSEAPTETQPSSEPTPTEAQSSESESSVSSDFQLVYYSISGGCYESYEAMGEYALFEEYYDDCYIIVEVLPTQPSRQVTLQFYEDGWVTETSASTGSGGIAYLDVDPYCDDGYWCDGYWDYRVVTDPASGQPEDVSPTFELRFIAF